ncbi:hypothetical protein [Arcticibacterium luteifluviistationis]|uniref:Uncharacterized protein n=1 Tax=Arcticibacterium luteifluviistationis TaxID=1784714 RepID=A0A2Z4G880_9BACT|nr:hypothetical protein [Arcticibacterium luteifluviistationis]AWV97377.1 hypothetical protein DJ013_03995 [Arcticibacterium luteifluviistationis]
MNRKLFNGQVIGLSLVIGLSSFAYLKSDKDGVLKANELSYSNTKIELSFGGLEEFIGKDADLFRTDIYLSDVNLNDATFNSREQIVMVLKNHMVSKRFENGTYKVASDFTSGESNVHVELMALNGELTDVEVISGNVSYKGTYPHIELEVDLLLSNGESLAGSYSKEMETFKYFF